MSELTGENSSLHSSAPGESKSQPSPWLPLDQEAEETQLPVSTGEEDSGLEAKTRSGAGGGAGPSPSCQPRLNHRCHPLGSPGRIDCQEGEEKVMSEATELNMPLGKRQA